MYRDLKMQLQDYAAGTIRDDDAEIMFDALNAIEKLEHKVFILEGDREGLLAQIPRWIPVSERLPEPYTWVLVSAEKHKVAFDAFYDGAQWKDAVLNGLIVTHWMPLPEPPKEE